MRREFNGFNIFLGVLDTPVNDSTGKTTVLAPDSTSAHRRTHPVTIPQGPPALFRNFKSTYRVKDLTRPALGRLTLPQIHSTYPDTPSHLAPGSRVSHLFRSPSPPLSVTTALGPPSNTASASGERRHSARSTNALPANYPPILRLFSS